MDGCREIVEALVGMMTRHEGTPNRGGIFLSSAFIKAMFGVEVFI